MIKSTLRTAILCFVTCLTLSTFAQDSNVEQESETLIDPRLTTIYSNVRGIVRRHYPEATSHLLENKIHFESDTQVFIIHIPLKTGEWQSPREVRGPKMGGILGEIELRNGHYEGAAMVPQSIDYHYYKLMLMAPYSEEYDCHLYVRLYVPRLKSNPDFINELTTLVNNFETMINE